MNVLGISLIMILAILVLLVLLYIVAWYGAHDFDKILKITYKQFISMYAINPNSWKLVDDYTVQYTYPSCRSMPKAQWFYFGPIDTLKYQHFCRVKKAQIPKEILKAFQKDIDNYKEQYSKDLEKKVKEIDNFISEHEIIDEKWKDDLKNVILRIYNDFEESKKAQ